MDPKEPRPVQLEQVGWEPAGLREGCSARTLSGQECTPTGRVSRAWEAGHTQPRCGPCSEGSTEPSMNRKQKSPTFPQEGPSTLQRFRH